MSAQPLFSLRPGKIEDLPEAVKMFNLAAREMSGKDEYDLADYQNEWRDPSLDLARNTRIAHTADGKIVGCVEVWSQAPFVHSWIWARVHPEFRGQGIGTDMMQWAEARVRENLPLAPAGARVYMESASDNDHPPTNALLADLGFRPVRHSLTMERALDAVPAPEWPAGISIRTAQPGEELAIYRAVDEVWRDHHGYIETAEDEGFKLWTHRLIDDPAYDPSLWFLATDGDQIAGMALCQARRPGDPAQGWVDRLGVRRPWRKHGLALALLYHAFGELRARGAERVALGVDGESLTGATRLYERAGMHAASRSTSFEKQLRAGKELATKALEA